MSWILAAGQPITVEEFNDSIAPLFSSLPLGENVFPIIVLILGFVATALLLHRSKWGRYIYAIGDNEAPRESPACRSGERSCLFTACPPAIYQGVLGAIVLAVVLLQARLRR